MYEPHDSDLYNQVRHASEVHRRVRKYIMTKIKPVRSWWRAKRELGTEISTGICT